MKRQILILMAMVAAAGAYAIDPCTSPDGRIALTYGSDGFAVSFDGEQVLSIPEFGLAPGANTLLGVEGPTVIDIDYDMPVGKKSHCTNKANEYKFNFNDAQGKPFTMDFMLLTDGVGFRYEGAEGPEQTLYRIPEGTPRYMQRFNPSYEDFFPRSTTGEGQNRNWGYPALIHPADNAWVLLTEAGIRREHAASTLKNEGAPTDYRVTPSTNNRAPMEHFVSPWRVAIIGSLPQLVESTLVTDLSPAPEMTDTDWIEPGGVSWVYWAYNRGSKDFQIVKQYIDMAASMKLPYVLIDWEWDVMGNGGDINDAIKYAHEKGVKVLVWYNSSTAWTTNGAGGPLFRLNKPEDREKEYTWLNELGVSGIKIDFFDGDTQETMEYCIDLLEDAAKHHLLVNLHGATIPRGWQRTYPNLMSVEAVYGAEWYNNLPVLTNRAAAHNATLPFTRNIIGPMDYTPCAFSDSQHPHITSHAHELALGVLFESALQHWADKPESYLAQPAEVQELIGTVPTTWDETRLLGGYPADYVVMARRKGADWYVAAINGRDEARQIDIDWSVLGPDSYTVRLYEDSGNAASPWQITERQTSASQLPLTVTLQPRGGIIARCTK